MFLGSMPRWLVRVAPFLLLNPGTASTCELSTDSTTGELRFRFRGTVRLVEVEGGCWQFVADDGSHYELRPDQAPASLLRDGARATLVLEPRDDLASVCQVGTIADVARVDDLDSP